MRCIGYISSATAIDNIESDVKDIIQKAIAHNDAQGITGLMVYNDGNFLQFIEGDDDAVNYLFKRISSDIRHKDILVIFDETIERRAFGNWSSALKEIKELPEQCKTRCSKLMKLSLSNASAAPEHLKIAADFVALYRDGIR